MKRSLLTLVVLCLAAVARADKAKTQVDDSAPTVRGRQPEHHEWVLGADPNKKKKKTAKPAPLPAAAPPASKSFEKAKVLTSNSPSGPFVQDGTVCGSGQVYTRTTGLDRTKPPMGCASPFESNDCMDVKNHRKFEPGEWLDPFTIQTIVNGADYPAGKYGMYLSYSKTDVKRVGFATLKSCAPPALKCAWETHEFVVGPCDGPGCSGEAKMACTTATRGATGRGGGGTWTCVCK